MGVAEIIALGSLGVATLALGGSGVNALWKIARGLGSSEGKIATALEGISKMLRDHEERLRELEARR